MKNVGSPQGGGGFESHCSFITANHRKEGNFSAITCSERSVAANATQNGILLRNIVEIT